MQPSLPRWMLLAALWMAALAMPAQAASSATTRSDAGNTYISGESLRIAEPVKGDLFAAGRAVDIASPVAADVAAAGASVDVRADIGQDVRVAGNSVNIAGNVGGDLVAAGNSVVLAQSASVAGEALLAAREVQLDGSLRHGARVYAQKITVSGLVEGDARLTAEEVTLGPRARINGNLVYASTRELPAEQRARVTGSVTREETPQRWQAQPERHVRGPWVQVGFFLSMLLCGALLVWLAPRGVAGARQAITGHPLRCLLVGVALLFTVPPLSVVFMITLIGIPIGIGMLLLYPVMLLLGFLASAFYVAHTFARWLRRPPASRLAELAFLALALLAMALLAAIPGLGPFLMLLAVVAGTGGWAVWLLWREPPRAEVRPAPDAGARAAPA